MNADLYRELAIPKPWTILGLRLRPFAVGHKLLLQCIGSPYEFNGDPDIADLALAVEICSGTYEDGLATLDDPKGNAARRSWIKRLGKVDWVAKGVEFRNYLAFHSRFYSFSKIGQNQPSTPNETPLLHSVVSCLMNDLHLTESQSMNRCFGLAMCDYIVCAEGVYVADPDKMKQGKELANQFKKELMEGKVRL